MHDLIEKGKDEVLRKYNLKQEAPIPSFSKTKKGTDAEESGTAKAYENRWKDMHKFFTLVGKAESALLTDRVRCPDRPLPMCDVAVRMYFSYHFGECSQTLLHPDTKVPVRDVHNNPIVCTGSWKNPANVNKARAAIKALHNLYDDLRGDYLTTCDDCLKYTEQYKQSARHSACDTHAGQPRIRNHGNVVNCHKVADHITHWKARLAGYKAKGNVQLLPSEVRQLRNLLLNDGSLAGLQKYVMILLGIKSFLRADELISIKVAQFKENLFLLSETDGPTALTVTVQGKNDPAPVDLILFHDKENPEFCPVRHLLCYIRLAGVEDGYIFPPPKELLKSVTGNYYEHYSYDDFLASLKSLVQNNLKRADKKGEIYGTHILRKTGYLFAIFGVLRGYAHETDSVSDLQMANILKSARHTSVANAQTYARDAMTLCSWNRRAAAGIGPDTNSVSRWESIHIDTVGPFESQCAHMRMLQKSLPDVAGWYFQSVLKLHVDARLTPLQAVDAALKFGRQTVTEQQHHAFLRRQIPDREAFEEAWAMHQSVTKEAITTVTPILHSPNDPTPGIPTAAGMPPAAATEEEPKSKKRSHGDMSMPESTLLKDMTKLDKAAKMLEIYHQYKGVEKKSLTGSARKLYYGKIRPVALCVHTCFSDSVDDFCKAIDKLNNGGTFSCSQTSACKGTLDF